MSYRSVATLVMFSCRELNLRRGSSVSTSDEEKDDEDFNPGAGDGGSVGVPDSIGLVMSKNRLGFYVGQIGS